MLDNSFVVYKWNKKEKEFKQEKAGAERYAYRPRIKSTARANRRKSKKNSFMSLPKLHPCGGGWLKS